MTCTIRIDEEAVLHLQVEYCFTGEGSDAFPAPTSLRGLDAGIYYRTGSLLNAGHAAVRALVVDSLKHWAREYDVDGFCFVNAENMVQGELRAPSSHACHASTTWVSSPCLK